MIRSPVGELFLTCNTLSILTHSALVDLVFQNPSDRGRVRESAHGKSFGKIKVLIPKKKTSLDERKSSAHLISNILKRILNQKIDLVFLRGEGGSLAISRKVSNTYGKKSEVCRS